MDDLSTINNLDNSQESQESTPSQPQSKMWIYILIAVLILGLLITAIVFLSKAGPDVTSSVRDIFIILMAFESIVIGVVLVVLVVQISTLINLVQNEIKPILKSTSETIDTLKGTSQFLSNNLVDPVIKANGYMAGVKHLIDLLKITKK